MYNECDARSWESYWKRIHYMSWLDNINKDHKNDRSERDNLGQFGNRKVTLSLSNVSNTTKVFKHPPYCCWKTSFLVPYRLSFVQLGLKPVRELFVGDISWRVSLRP